MIITNAQVHQKKIELGSIQFKSSFAANRKFSAGQTFNKDPDWK